MKPAVLINQIAYLMALLFIFSIPWENAITFRGIGTISHAVGLPLIGAWALMLLTSKEIRTPSPFLVILFCFVFWSILSLLWNNDTGIAFRQVKTYFQLFISILIIWSCLDSETRCHNALKAYLIGAWVVAIVVFYNYYSGNVTRWDRRASIAGADENDIALTLATCLPVAWYLGTMQSRNMLGRIASVLCFAYLPCAIVAIVMTGSRGGVASTIPFFIYLLFSLQTMKISSKLASVVFVILAAFAASFYIPETPLQRIIGTLEQLDSRNISGRYDIWLEGLSIWWNSGIRAFFGLGIGGYYAEVGRVAHSTYISIIVETGIVGISLFVAALAALIFAIYHAPRRERQFAFALLAIWAIGAAALSWEYRKPTWVIWGLISSLVYLRAFYWTAQEQSNPPAEESNRSAFSVRADSLGMENTK